MKKYFLLVVLFGLVSCDDGDLQIESIDFDDIAVQDCGSIDPTAANFLFKIDGEEALILELPSGVLDNGNSRTDTVETMRSFPSESSLRYRLFSANVTSSYFCDDIPPITPTVSQEITAESGTVIIKSIANADSTAFTHVIQLSNTSFIDAGGARLTNLTVTNFGEISTAISN